MTWILACLEYFKVELVVNCDLQDQNETMEHNLRQQCSLSLGQLEEDILIRIFKYLNLENLVALERVSWQFFLIVAKTFQDLRHITTRVDRAPFLKLSSKAHPGFDPVSFVNRFGPQLETVPFVWFKPLIDSGDLDEKYFKRLAWRFPNISDVDRLDADQLDWLLVFVNESDWKCQLRKLEIFFPVQRSHLERRELSMFKIKTNLIISQCSKFQKLEVQMFVADYSIDFESSLFETFYSDFGLMLKQFCSAVNQVILVDDAVHAILRHVAEGQVKLQRWELLSFTPDEILADVAVSKYCRFAPNARKVRLKPVQVTALKCLSNMETLQVLHFETALRPNFYTILLHRDEKASVKEFFQKRGKGLTKARFSLMDSQQVIPIIKWLTRYCSNLLKLVLTHQGNQDLTQLKLPKMTRFKFTILVTRDRELEALLTNNPKLRLIKLICANRKSLQTVVAFFETVGKTRQKMIRSLTVRIEANHCLGIEIGVPAGIPLYCFSF
ncbi:hypothetical protein HDE_09366 [Halotydeus destructor]|nr:hypothetical protein HDE_09366 [Halotydeus destructor]